MNTEPNDSPQPDNVTRPGDMLRQAREQLGYSQTDIANRLRLRLSVIDDIESNCFDIEKISTFTRGYVRSYAKYVGLDDVAVVALLDDYGHSKPKAQEMQSFSRRTKREAHDSRIMGLTWILAVIFVGVTAVWWWQNSHLDQDLTPAVKVAKEQSLTSETISSTTVAPSAVVASTEIAPVSAAKASANSDVSQTPSANTEIATSAVNTSTSTSITSTAPVITNMATETAPVTDATSSTDATSIIDAIPANEIATPVVNKAAPALQLAFSADCWVDIRDANGKRLQSGIKKAGQLIDINGKAPFRVRLGAPSAVKIEIKGQPFDLSRYPASKPVTLMLPQ